MLIFADMNDSISNISTISNMASMPTLAAMSPMVVNLLIGLFLVVCITMILLVLIQRPQGGGLSGAFGSGGGGGGGAGQTAFGTKTGDVLTWATIGIFVTFLGFAIVLNFATRPPEPTSVESILTAPIDAGAGTIEPEETTDLSSTLEELAEDVSEDLDGETIQDAAEETVEDLPVIDSPAQDD